MRSAATITIRSARESDFDSIWEIFHEVVEAGESYVYDPQTTKEQAYSIWMAGGVKTYVACLGERVVGTYILKPNQPGLGSHVANAGYMVSSRASGQGVGRAMCEHSLSEARRAGFTAMQFNMVVSTNEAAIALWKKLGFAIVGTLPEAFRHKRLGLVDAYVMHRFL
ncbi:MAG TPA: GNAT family N-acetyltransferase [Pyrinomonadaceae bacterium]|jgi:L-amino acid N-acyltransferase YncA